MIEIQNLSKHFGTARSGLVQALQDVNLELPNGQIVGLLGLNGAGKTTLMRLIYGLLEPSAGSIRVDGLDVRTRANAARRRLGVLPDDTGLYRRLTARENIAYFGRLHGMAEADLQRHSDELIDLLGMAGIAERRAEGFSLGERMKTALARAIVHQPSHILLDEPTNGLDVITTRAVRKLLLTLRDRGRCVLFSSHLMHEVNNLCDRVILIARGRIVADGTVAEVVERAGESNLEDAFVKLTGAEEVARG